MNAELLEKAKGCKNAEDLQSLAADNGMKITLEQAEAKLADLKREGEMQDDELDSVAGGGCENGDGSATSDTVIAQGDIVTINDPSLLEWGCAGISCTCCGSSFKLTAVRKNAEGVTFGTLECMACAKKHAYRTMYPQVGKAFNVI